MTASTRFRELLRERSRRHGSRPAVVVADGAADYRELADRAAAAAAEIRACGVGTGAPIGLALPNSVAFLTWFFGILDAGGVVVPLPPSATPTERRTRCEEGGVGWIVSGPEALVRRTRAVSTPVAPASGAHGDVVAHQFSSGSTGRAKLILRTGENFSADAAHFGETLGVNAADRFLGVAPFHHAYGGLSFLAAFAAGASVVVLPRFLPGPVIETARRQRPTIFLATPPMIEVLGSCALAAGDEEAFRSVRHCVCSAGPLGRAAHDAFVARFGVPVRVQYGSTETLAATIDREGGFEEGRVGRPFDGVEVRVCDEEGNPLPPGVPGRVGVRSAAVCAGYANDLVETAARFRDGYAFPGDRGFMDDHGVLHLLGRSDVINVGGLKVDPNEVADVIRAGLPVTSVLVLAGRWCGAPAVCAVVEADPGVVTPAMVVGACRTQLSAYKVPARVVVVERIPTDESGKVIRSMLDLGDP